MKVYTELPESNRKEILRLIVLLASKTIGSGAGWLLLGQVHSLKHNLPAKVYPYLGLEYSEKFKELTHSEDKISYKEYTFIDYAEFIKCISDPQTYQIPKPKIILGGQTVTFTDSGIQVGCQYVDKETILKIAEQFK